MKRPASPGYKNNKESWKNDDLHNVEGSLAVEVILAATEVTLVVVEEEEATKQT
jgi:hypothetical protein